MKSLSIASLAVVLALSGCSSSPSISIEEETELKVKLIEYEFCLETQREFYRKFADPRNLDGLALLACEDVRP